MVQVHGNCFITTVLCSACVYIQIEASFVEFWKFLSWNAFNTTRRCFVQYLNMHLRSFQWRLDVIR